MAKKFEYKDAFLELLKAGLWEKEVNLAQFGYIDFKEIYRIAEEQSVVGLIAAGLDYVVDIKVPQEIALMFVGSALQLEQRNATMNDFVAELVERLRGNNIYSVLVKGQGIAQCYLRPLWRSSGDVDLLLNEDNYLKACKYLKPIATIVDEEDTYKRHCALKIGIWDVELHGTMRSDLWKSVDNVIDSVQNVLFDKDSVRLWMNGTTQIYLPRADEDVVFVFVHILQHFYKEGIGLRQVCDWMRLLWTFKGSINVNLLEKRILEMGIMTEWKAYAALAVEYLGLPSEAIPFYSKSICWKNKAAKVLAYIFKTGNFGHNRDYSYYRKYPFWVYKTISLWRHTKDGFAYFTMFPLDSLKIWAKMLALGIRVAVKQK